MYKNILKDLDIEPPYEPEYAVHTYLKFPLLSSPIFKENGYFSPLRRWKKPSTRAPFSHFVGGKLDL